MRPHRGTSTDAQAKRPKPRSTRTNLTEAQITRLNQVFEFERHPGRQRRDELSRELGVPLSVIRQSRGKSNTRGLYHAPQPHPSALLRNLVPKQEGAQWWQGRQRSCRLHGH